MFAKIQRSFRAPLGVTLGATTHHEIDALAYAMGKAKSRVIEAAIPVFIASLPADERAAFERALHARAA